MADSGKETIIIVPEAFAMAPPGFAIDAGGSITKLVYRDKSDYTRDETGAMRKLRLRWFDHSDYEGVLKLIGERCYLPPRTDQKLLAFHTGNNLDQLRTRMDQTFHTETVLQSENDAIAKGYITLLRHMPNPHCPVTVETCRTALTRVHQLIDSQKQLILLPGTLYRPPSTVNPSVTHLTPETLSHLCNNSTVEFPCLLIGCGSATFAIELFENGKYKINFFTTNGGKTYYGLSCHMTGAKTYDELMELVVTGHSQNVDVTDRDIQTAGQKYSAITPDTLPTDLTVNALGKLTEKDDKPSPNDVAAGVLRLHCQTLAEIAVANAYIVGLKSIIMTGSFLREPVVTETMYGELLRITLMKHYEGNYLITPHILKNPGFVVALGCWAYSLQQKRDSEL